MQYVALDAGAAPTDDRLVRLGHAIRDSLETAGASQQWLADQLKLNNAQVSRLINGRVKNVSVELVRKIEDVLGLGRGQILLQAGYIGREFTARQMIASDTALEPNDRATVLRIYDALAEAGDAKAPASSTAPTATRSRRS